MTLSAFANDETNFYMEDNGDGQYTSAYSITKDTDDDSKMKEAAGGAVDSYYNFLASSCIDLASDALEKVGLNGGSDIKVDPITRLRYKEKIRYLISDIRPLKGIIKVQTQHKA
jgi:hypothetical protein